MLSKLFGLLQPSNPSWWTTVATLVLGTLGVSDTGLPVDVKTTITGVVGIAVAVYTHEHHATIRNADNAAAAIQKSAAAQAVQTIAGGHVTVVPAPPATTTGAPTQTLVPPTVPTPTAPTPPAVAL